MNQAPRPRPTDEQHLANVQERRRVRMAGVDRMPVELRALVHEYGLYVVQAFLSQGISKPKAIRHITEVILNEFSPTRGSYSSQGVRTAPGMPHMEDET